MARARRRVKISQLEEALHGLFTDHPAFLLRAMLARTDQLNAEIAALDDRIEAEIGPFADGVARLDQIRGIGPIAARVIIAEVGVDMSHFPAPAHLASWARFAPGVKESAARKKGNGGTGHGNRYPASVLGEAAISAGRSDTFLGERYRRIARRRGKKRALLAVGRFILVIVWHLLTDPDAEFVDLGVNFYDTRLGTERGTRNHIQHLEALGYKVSLEPAA